jgi:hypothetical protein
MLIGKVSDGTNFVTSSQTISQIDNTVPNVSSVVSGSTGLTSSGFTITRSGNAADDGSGLAANPYIYQISTNGTTWITKCTDNGASCAVTGLSPSTTYYYKICVVDIVGNQTCVASKTVTTASAVMTFNYTGGSQLYTIPLSGTYRLESYGAQGGGNGGKGGYVKGDIYLNSGDVITILVGGQNGYNGGGTGGYIGGGSTIIKKGATNLMIAAGGGGGATGTAGGNGTGAGGSGSSGTGYPSASPSSYTAVNGAAGTNGGGGGSGNIYKNCLTTKTVVVPNTCYECAEWTCDCVCHKYVGGTCVSESCQCHGPCIGGMIPYDCSTSTQVCDTYSAEATNGGQGGSNTIGSLTNTSSSNGTNSGNGKFVITFVGS